MQRYGASPSSVSRGGNPAPRGPSPTPPSAYQDRSLSPESRRPRRSRSPKRRRRSRSPKKGSVFSFYTVFFLSYHTSLLLIFSKHVITSKYFIISYCQMIFSCFFLLPVHSLHLVLDSRLKHLGKVSLLCTM